MKKENFKHTPGPWQINDGSSIEHCTAIEADKGPFAYVELWDGEDETEQAEANANARLIAAAPEMLEALQLVVDGLSAFVFKMNVKDHFSEKLAMESARTAIKKALGE